MEAGSVSRRVVLDRLAWLDRMLGEIRRLPLDDREAFMADSRNAWTAESCLRRALEAIFDIGRHVLAKGFAQGSTEYKEVASRLAEHQVLSAGEANLLRRLAGYRNRMVHFYHEVSPDELFDLCRHHLDDLATIGDAYRRWLRGHEALLADTL